MHWKLSRGSLVWTLSPRCREVTTIPLKRQVDFFIYLLFSLFKAPRAVFYCLSLSLSFTSRSFRVLLALLRTGSCRRFPLRLFQYFDSPFSLPLTHMIDRCEITMDSLAILQAAYWATRRKELRDVEAAAAERKKKYANAGMTFTAQAMSSRGTSFSSQS